MMRARMPTPLRIVLSAAFCACACAPPPEASPGQLRLGIVQDSAIFQVIEAFQIHVVKATTTAGASVSCGDIPSTFRVGNPQLVSVVDPVGFAWKPSSDEAHSPTFQVPSDEKLVVIVQGLTRHTTGVHAVARGCVDSTDEGGARVALTFKPGTTQNLGVDVRATTGAACTTQADCELDLICQTGTDWKGGYCAKVGCTGDQVCPPGSRCVSTTSGGLCLGICDAPKDCDTSRQDCIGRVGPTTSGCASVCGWPLWNSSKKCTP
jgi:hypothetical protein